MPIPKEKSFSVEAKDSIEEKNKTLKKKGLNDAQIIQSLTEVFGSKAVDQYLRSKSSK